MSIFSRSSRSGRVLLAAAVLGLVVRLIVLTQTADLGPRIVDEQHYTQLATNLARGDGFGWGPGELTSIRPPLYPALVAGVWLIAGEESFQVVRVLQIALAAIGAWLVSRLGLRTFGADAGRYAAAAWWLYPSFVFFNFTILTETLFTLLFVAFILLAVRLVQEPVARVALMCGLVLGLAALTRSVLWPLPLVLCPLLLVLLPGPLLRRAGLSACVLAGFVLIVSPWAVRNTRLQGVVTIVDTMGGLNMRMGNYEHTPDDRMWDAVSITGEKSWSYALQQEFPGQSLTEGQKEKWAQKKAIEYMIANPGQTLRRSAIRFADFWGLEREFAAGVWQGLYAPPRWFSLPVSAIIVLTYCVVALLFAGGLWLAAPPWRVHVLLLLAPLAIMGVHSLVFGHSRYHLPLVPVMLLHGSAVAVSMRTVAWRSPQAIGAGLTAALFIAIWARQVLLTDAGRIRELLSHVW